MEEIRSCPKGCVKYNVNYAITNIGGPPHSEKRYCPICGTFLKVQKIKTDGNYIYTKEIDNEVRPLW